MGGDVARPRDTLLHGVERMTFRIPVVRQRLVVPAFLSAQHGFMQPGVQAFTSSFRAQHGFMQSGAQAFTSSFRAQHGFVQSGGQAFTSSFRAQHGFVQPGGQASIPFCCAETPVCDSWACSEGITINPARARTKKVVTIIFISILLLKLTGNSVSGQFRLMPGSVYSSRPNSWPLFSGRISVSAFFSPPCYVK